MNNYDWFKQISFLDFIRDTGKHITVNYMMAKDSVKKRIEGEQGMSLPNSPTSWFRDTILLAVQNLHCKLQMGGSDQWAISSPAQS